MEWVNTAEAVKLSGRNKVNVYKWARKGYVRSKVEVTSPRQIRGLMFFVKEDVVKVAQTIGVGARLDIYSIDDYADRPIVHRKEPVRFTEEQLEIARRVFGK